MTLKGKDIVNIDDLSLQEIETILDSARRMVDIAKGRKGSNALEGKILASLFFEPSTRTRLSFETAMQRLGGGVITIAGQEGSSLIKGETLADTIRMADGYSDIIVMRHPREGAARMSATFSENPVINGGDGAGQHPTQTLLDLFTMREKFGRIDGLHVTLVGDLRYGRTTHSLSLALARMGASMSFVSPDIIRMPDHIVNDVKELGVEVNMTNDLKAEVPGSDVIYMTRIQKERFAEEEEYLKVAHSFRIEQGILENAKREMIIMHPLPRVDEIDPSVDFTSHARYFEQAFNGVPVRMALLKLVLEGE
ncbi:aspartate carbamoyltransferase [Thermoplasmatales archaeon ex4484_6]|nr:MAG: aspartate carbamoyltransferase [Thermoplasmatales archaeon ex4484_6]RLF69358.1 MAG: aspartate carbamoyltransferase [Thermoplasmata archaeon]